ncbi:family 16 glycoside hydrolase [Georgenia sp. Z1491]|uniref:family 16 glycoside hydrolase n=1 Tax=Georgenia sp. Z1491 TaxID=3416707 RepID=UPI003CE951C4
MTRRSTGSRWLPRAAGALLAGVLVAPMTLSAASANPDHPPSDPADPPPAAPVQEGDTDWNDYERILLSKDTGEPIDLAVLPDSRVLHTARDGVVRLTDPDTGTTNEIAQLDVYANSEDGLQGISLDPNFEENNLVYMVYAPRVMDGVSPSGLPYPETTPQGSAPEQIEGSDSLEEWEQWLGYNVLSRFVFDPEAGTLDLDSEEEIIRIEAQRGQCCHVGADMAWDSDGNLYLSTGDNTPAGTPGANGYTPINNASGMNPGLDARRGAGSTNDLRGAILRIDPLEEIAADAEVGPGTTYEIPEGNLFDTGEYDPDLVREEIYAMGLRNPFRIDYDLETDTLIWADYGPDAGSASDERGPMGFVEWQMTSEPLNGGWPYCHGPNDGGAYNEWDFETSTPGEFFDCDAGPVNNSTWNTGLEQLPPVTEPQIWYGDNPGDQPAEWDALVTLGGGGQAPMGGPVYRYDETSESTIAFPEEWDGTPFLAEFSQDYVVSFGVDELGSNGSVTSISDFLPNAHLETANMPVWNGVMDMEFGPDGALYVLDYGDGFFRQNPGAGLYRVDYAPDNKTPQARFTADPVASSEAPLDVAFDASESRDPEGGDLTYEWDFDGDGEFDAEGVQVTHTFAELGQVHVTLRVTDPEGKVGLANTPITVGNTAPEVSLSVPDGAIFDWGDDIPMSVSVTDAEDGDTPECGRVAWTFGLGHNEHAHPEVSGNGCDFTIETNESAVEHGEGEKIYGTLVVTYTDEPQGEVPATTGEATLITKPEVQQGEWYNSQEGIEVANDPGASAGSYVTSFDEGDHIAFQPIAFTHAATGEPIDTVAAQASGEGTLALRWNDVAADPFAEIEISGGDGWQEVATTLETIPEGSGTVYVTSTGGVDLDFLHFTASGGGEEPAPEPPVCEDPDAEISADDEFDGTVVDTCRWDIINYDPELATVADGAYNVTTTDADFYAGDNSPVPNILQNRVLTGDQWTVETTFSADLGSAYQQGGIIVYGDEDNYVKLDPVYATNGSDTPLRVELRSEVGGEIQNPQDDLTDLPLSDEYHVRLTRDGDTFTGAFSTDGETWQDLPSAVTNDQVGDAGPGIYALGAQQAEPTTVSFDHFRVVGDDPEPPVCEPVEVEEGYTPLFDGTQASLDAWNMAGPGSFELQEDCTALTTGGMGLLWFPEEFDAYSLRLDWMMAGDDNSGVFVGFPEPGDDPWVAVNEGYEIQIDATDEPDRTTGAIYTFQGADEAARDEALNPPGEWNAYEIVVDDPMIEVYLNDVLINEFESTDPARDLSSGYIGLQNHGDGDDVSFRNVRIAELDDEEPPVEPEPVPPTPGRGFYLNDGWGIWADHEFSFGRPGDEVLVGDWDGDGSDTLAVRRGNAYFLSNNLYGGNADVELTFGRASDTVLVGDWDGDGSDSFAVRRGNSYFLTNSLSGGNAEAELDYGRADDQVLVGDYDADGADSFAVRRGNTYYVSNSLNSGWADAEFDYGQASDDVLVGDWDGDGADTFASRRGNLYLVSNSLTGGWADIEVRYGRAGDEVFVGDWNGDGSDTLGVRR